MPGIAPNATERLGTMLETGATSDDLDRGCLMWGWLVPPRSRGGTPSGSLRIAYRNHGSVGTDSPANMVLLLDPQVAAPRTAGLGLLELEIGNQSRSRPIVPIISR
jgi:hypothetical protein